MQVSIFHHCDDSRGVCLKNHDRTPPTQKWNARPHVLRLRYSLTNSELFRYTFFNTLVQTVQMETTGLTGLVCSACVCEVLMRCVLAQVCLVMEYAEGGSLYNGETTCSLMSPVTACPPRCLSSHENHLSRFTFLLFAWSDICPLLHSLSLPQISKWTLRVINLPAFGINPNRRIFSGTHAPLKAH